MDCKDCLLRDDCKDKMKDRSICGGFEKACHGLAMIKEVCMNGIELCCDVCKKTEQSFDTRAPGDWFWLEQTALTLPEKH